VSEGRPRFTTNPKRQRGPPSLFNGPSLTLRVSPGGLETTAKQKLTCVYHIGQYLIPNGYSGRVPRLRRSRKPSRPYTFAPGVKLHPSAVGRLEKLQFFATHSAAASVY